MKRRDKLRHARIKRGLLQEAAAGLLGVSRNTWSLWERGKEDPYPLNIGELCKFFGVEDPSDLDLESSMNTREDSLARQHSLSPDFSCVIADDALAMYTCGIAACQDLYYGGNPHCVEAILPLYSRQTAMIAQQSSPFKQTAARLASMAQHLSCELATDREDFGAAQQAGQQAFLYAEMADDTNLQVAALIGLANLGFHRKLSITALQAYQRAVSLLNENVTPLLKGRTYAGIAEVYAMRKDLQASMRAMGMAYEHYPMKPEDDPAYPYLRASRYALFVFGDVQSRLFLGQAKEADKALVAMQQETNDPQREPITRLDMLYYQADVRTQQNKLEESSTILTEAGLLAKNLGSRLYFNKLAVIYHQLQAQWPKEASVVALEEVFQPW